MAMETTPREYERLALAAIDASKDQSHEPETQTLWALRAQTYATLAQASATDDLIRATAEKAR